MVRFGVMPLMAAACLDYYEGETAGPFSGVPALHGAVACNQPSIVKYLIEQGAEVNAKNRLGWTPLMIAGGLYIANAH